ncbi:MAG: hypothetical protein ABIJ18_05175 [archaeon]
MLKKAQFAWNVDLVGGVILLIIGFVLFTILLNAQELKTEEQQEIAINSFEQEQYKLDLLNLLSNEVIYSALLETEYFYVEPRTIYSDYNYPEGMFYFDEANYAPACFGILKEEFQNTINREKWVFQIYDGEESVFICQNKIQCGLDCDEKDIEVQESIILPTKNPEKTLRAELVFYNE